MTENSVPSHLAGAVLSVDLDALAANYALLRDMAADAEAAAVVKADAYGTGIEQAAPRLWADGCRTFFVAHVGEGMRLRSLLGDADIHILNGLLPGAEQTYIEHRLVPALGSLDEMTRWKAACGATARPCDIHVDTGMLRLGLPPDELDALARDASLLHGFDIRLVMSHFASADEATAQNADQLSRFRQAREILPMGLSSFANSSGIFLGPDYRGDVVRPGVALYGCNPTPGRDNPMRPVVSLHARILQVRDAGPGETVSYGATYSVEKPMRIATVSAGYADGYLRSLSGNGRGFIGGRSVPVIGRVTMDLTMLDVSDVAFENCRPGDWVELIGPHIAVDEVAAKAGTIGYEILTSLGRRYHRRYLGG